MTRATGELQGTAKSLNDTASGTHQLANSVSVAATEASKNVQSVAIAGSIGLVVEPKRYDDDPNDAFEWYCFECGNLVHRIEVKVEHLVRDLPPLYEAFFNDEKARTCKKCGALHPGKKPPPGWVTFP